MKKKRKPYTRRFLPLRLYRDDIDDLLAVFEQNGEKVKIAAGEYELESSNDLEKLKAQTLHNLTLETVGHSCEHCSNGHGYLSLDFERNRASLYISDETDTQLLGMAAQLEAILRRKRSFVSYVTSYWAIYAVLFASTIPADVGAGLSLVFTLLHRKDIPGAVPLAISSIGLVISSIVLLYVVCATYIRQQRHTMVYLVRRSEKSGFFQRNKDQIIVGIAVGTICAVIGAIVGAIVTVALTTPPR